MEDLIYDLRRRSITAADVYAQLLPESRRAWEQHWHYIHDAPWPR
jgi:hypothetical protein